MLATLLHDFADLFLWTCCGLVLIGLVGAGIYLLGDGLERDGRRQIRLRELRRIREERAKKRTTKA